MATGSVVATTTGRPLGWYDDTHFIRAVAGSMLEVVQMSTGTVLRSVSLAGLPGEVQADYQFGSTAGFTGNAEARGF